MTKNPIDRIQMLEIFGAVVVFLAAAIGWVCFAYYTDYPGETLYVVSILSTMAIAGFLSIYAWQQREVKGALFFLLMELAVSVLALFEILSILSQTREQALFWFNMRFLLTAFIPVGWLAFVLTFSGQIRLIPKHLVAGMLVIPAITPLMMWSNSLHGLWVTHDVGFHQTGPYWIAETSARVPAVWFMVHSFYSLLLGLTAAGLLFQIAWKKRQTYRAQALLFTVGTLISLSTSVIPIFTFIPQPVFNPFIPGLGLSALFYALAVFRFDFLKGFTRGDTGSPIPTMDPASLRSMMLFIFIFLLMATGLASIGYMSYQNYERQFRIQVESELSAIAALKINELEGWHAEQLIDAETLYENPALAVLAQQAFENPADEQTQAHLQAWLQSITNNGQYDRVTLLDADAVERFSAPDSPRLVPTHLEEVQKVLHTKQITFLDFQRDLEDGFIHLTILIPLLTGENADMPVGVLMLRIDPEKYLYPFINEWPVASTSAETLIVRQDGNDVLYLNDLRFDPSAALNLRVPLGEVEVPAVRAVNGQEGIVEGVDYRGVSVLADIHSVPNSPWFLVSKIDTDEVFAPLRNRAWETFFLVIAWILGTGAGLGVIWRQQRLRHYWVQYEAAESLRKSEERYRELVQQASDGIFLTDPQTNYIEVNQRGCDMLGYSRSELLTMKIADLIAPEDMVHSPPRLQELRDGKTLIAERRLKRKDGSLMPVEISASMFPDGRFQSIVRDITERKQAEETLHESEAKFSKAFMSNPAAIILSRLADGLQLDVNDAYCRLVGFSREELLGHPTTEFNIFLYPEQRRELVEQLKANGAIRNHEVTLCNKTGELHPVLISVERLEFNHEECILTTLVDITESKRVEETLRASEMRFRALFEDVPIAIWEEDFSQVKIQLDTLKAEGVTDFRAYFVEHPEVVTDLSRMIRVLDVNRAALKLYKAENKPELIESTSSEISPAEAEHIHEDLIAIAMGKPGNHWDGTDETMTGETIQISLSWSVVPGHERDYSKVIVTTMDVTERNRAEEALRNSEEKFRTVADFTYDWEYWVGPSGVMIYVSPSCEQISGHSAAEFLADPHLLERIIHPDDVAIYQTHMHEKFDQEHATSIDFRITKPNGEVRWINHVCQLVRGADGRWLGRRASNRDITERKRAEEELQLSNERFEKSFRAFPNGLVISVLTTGKILEVNDSFLEIFGYSRAEVLDRTSESLGLFEDMNDRQRLIQLMQQQGGQRNIEINVRRKSGEVRHVELSAEQITIRDESCLLTIINDITERKRMEQELQQKTDELDHYFTMSMDLFCIADTNGHFRRINKQWEKTLGYKIEELEGITFLDLIHPDDLDATRQALITLDSQIPVPIFNNRYRHKDGGYRWIEWSSFPQGNFIYAAARDITERKQAEKRLELQNQRLKTLREIDAAILASDSVENIVGVALDHIRELIGCERANLALIDWEKNEALNFDVRDTKESAIAKGARVSLDAIQDILLVLSHNQAVLMKDLTLLSDPPPQIRIFIEEGLRSRCILPLLLQGKVVGSLTLSSNIPDYFDEEKINLGREVANQIAIAISQNSLLNDLRTLNASLEQRVAQRTEELMKTNIELERANRAKDEFLATMSHELRTPLNSILGLSETLLEQRRDPLSEYQQRSLKTVASSGEHLLELINDILDLSKIEAGKFDCYPQIIGVDDLCRSSLAFVKEQAARKSITLKYENQKVVVKIYADPRRLKQILVNLLTNAVKFTPEHGQVVLHISADIEQGRILFSVIDTGIGIASDDLRQLFLPFSQVDSSLTREYEGTGLGLALVQKLTDLHGGSVDVESEVGRGSRFTVNLPIGQAMLVQQGTTEGGGERLANQMVESDSSSAKPVDRGRILLAEDNMANILTIGEYLESHGYHIVVAHNGFEAIEKAEEIHPNLFLMDIQMPALDGLEAIRRLRAGTRFATTPIIALTALAMPGDRERCLEAGANEYMSKPVSLKSLVKTIEMMINTGKSPST